MTYLTLQNANYSARLAGFLYLLIAVFGAFAIAYVPGQIVISGDGTKTAENLLSQVPLVRAGIVADTVVIGAELWLTMLLYHLLKPVDAGKSMLAAMARFGMILIMAVNLLMNVVGFQLVTGGFGSTGLDPHQTASVALILFEAHQVGVYVWGMLFALHLYVLGALVYRSGYLPRALGGAMRVGSLGYLIEGAVKITSVENEFLSYLVIGLLTIVTLAEISFALWLLVRGINRDRWRTATV